MTDTTADGESLIPKITRDDEAAGSGDRVRENVDRLKALFPQIVTDGKVDFDVLRQLLGDEVEEGEERYGLNWKGKRRARAFAMTPSLGTLRPAPEDSVDWDTTQNLMIEGDNLEVLKLLRRSYAGEVKLIYIDPPYNTGNDFVYTDDYKETFQNYLRNTGQIDREGRATSTDKESGGRFHGQWLNMIYPRLLLAAELLSDDGAIFVSIDENEIQNLRYVMDEAFGSENFVAVLSVLSNPKGRSQDKHFASNHDYVVVYSGSPLPKGAFSISKAPEEIEADYPLQDEGGKYRLLELRNTHREFGKFNRPGMYFPLYVRKGGSVSFERIPDAQEIYPDWEDGFEGCWTWGKEKAQAEVSFLFGKSVSGRMKIFRKGYAEDATKMLKTILTDKEFITERGQREFNALFEGKDKIFQSPKSPFLLGRLIETISKDHDIVLDFFAGSGTSGQAIMKRNALDGGRRRYILVQLPEQLSDDVASEKAAAGLLASLGRPKNIAELTKERLRRAGQKIRAEHPDAKVDTGFRVYKLATSNLKPWQPDPDNLEASILDAVDNVLPDRTEHDLLVELLLKTGIDLTMPEDRRTIAGQTVHALGGGALMVCLGNIGPDDAETLGQGMADWLDELDPTQTTIYFKDVGLGTDNNRSATKANLAAILRQRHGDRIAKIASI